MKQLFVILIYITLYTTAYCQDEQISFQSGSLTLNGTLSLPESGIEPFPLAILVHGSGPNDRNQTITLGDGNSLCLYPELFNQTIKNFEDIAKHLTENNIAVLRYDKRTLTHGQTLNEADVLVSDFITDIESAINYSKTRNEIDESEIFLIGHSQGSGLIPIAAINTGDVKGLISLAGPSTPIDSLLPEQIRHLYEKCANDPITGENVANQFYEQFNEIRNGTFPLNQQIMLTIPGNPNPIPQGYGSFWKNWIEISDDVIKNYSESNIKSLIIQGDEDFNVPVSDADKFANIPKAEIKIYTGINHFLTPSNVNMVSNQILIDIANWINSSITSSTEITQNQSIQFNIYRAGSEVIIETDGNCENCKFSIYDLTGKLLKSCPLHGKKTRILLQRENTLKAVVLSKGGKIYSKLIK